STSSPPPRSSNSLYLSVALPQLITSTRIDPQSAQGPGPVLDLRKVLAVLGHVELVAPERLAAALGGPAGHPGEPWDPVDHVERQLKPVHPVEHRHVERGRGRSFFQVAADVNVAVVAPPIGQAVAERRGYAVGAR